MISHQPIPASVRPCMRRSKFLGSPRLPVGLLLHWVTIATLVLAGLLLPAPARAYIPAQATNETGVAQAAGQNFSDVSKLSLQWYPMGSYSERISYQLVGADSTGISKVSLYFPHRTPHPRICALVRERGTCRLYRPTAVGFGLGPDVMEILCLCSFSVILTQGGVESSIKGSPYGL